MNVDRTLLSSFSFRSFVLSSVSILVFIVSFIGCSSQLQVTGWESLHGPEAQNISTVLVDGQTPTTLFAGLTNGLLLKSTDQGTSWTSLSTIAVGKTIYQIAQHPDDSRKIYAATGGGLFSSLDGGTNWKMVTPVAGATPSLFVERSFSIPGIPPAFTRVWMDMGFSNPLTTGRPG